MELSDLMPKNFSPEYGTVIYYEWNDATELKTEELQTLWSLLDDLEYRYDGRVSGGVMKGELYHLVFTDWEPVEQVNLFVTKKLGIVYLNDREYKMVGDTGPLLEFLNQLK